MKRVCLLVLILCLYSSMIYSSIHVAYPKKFIKTHDQQKVHKNHTKKESLRILCMVESFPHFDQPFILDQIIGLIDRGHDVYIACAFEVKNSIVPEVVERYNLMERTIFFGNANPFKCIEHSTHIPSLSTFDLICCQFGNIGASILPYINRIPKSALPKLVVCWRGASKEATIEPHLHKKLFMQVDLFLSVCEFLKKQLIGLGCDEHKIQVLHSGINYALYASQPHVHKDTIRFMSMCRLVEKKGIEYAIRAIASVIEQHPQIHYTIVGDGPLRKDLELLVQALQIQSYVTFIGNQPHEKTPEILRDADIFLSPSITTQEGNQEGIANALKEAMASGAIVIGTQHAGTDELIENGVSGFLVPERDIQTLSETICYLIAHPELWDSIRWHEQRVVKERFCLSDSIDQFIAIVKEMCAR